MKPLQPTPMTRDDLTGLANRDGARARLAEWLTEGAQVHAMLIGLRRFDAVNLAYGPATGDLALVEVANRLKHFAAVELAGGWFLARVGGGHFLLLSQVQSSREGWQLAAAQIMDQLARPIGTPGGTVRLSPRGVLLRGLAGEVADSILDRLGQTLEGLVAQPGKRLAWADGEATRAGRSAAQLESDLLRAIDANQIEVLFQPQYGCSDDRLIGAEALARWQHPELGCIGAGALFAIAERTDHVSQLSRHIARIALRHASRWPGDLRLSLNVTPVDLAADDFATNCQAQLKEARFPGWRLTLEITEQVLLADIAAAAKACAGLSGQGVRFALDDFGAGFCNFRYLKLLPLQYLKLDRSMIEGVAGDSRDLAVLRAIIAMASALDLKVIAEGVESEAQRLLAKAEGCSAYQGFLRSMPLSAGNFLNLARG
jgi:EAL domain-containing protein (putative c-di-GMP-specific phosphodiesterase class I)